MVSRIVKRRKRCAVTAMLTVLIVLAGSVTAYAADNAVTGKGWKPAKKKITAKMSRVSRNGKRFELRKAAGETLYKYDTVQGMCADDEGHGFYTLFNRKTDKCKLVKVSLEDMKVLKVSKALKVHHGNSLTFDTRRRRLVVANGDNGTWKITLVNPKNLKVIKNKKVKCPKKVKGMPKKVRRRFNGITAIAYNAKRDVYVARLKDEHNMVILTPKFKVKRYFKAQGKNEKMLFQGLDSYGDYTLDCESFTGKARYNVIVIRNWKGKVVSKVKIPPKGGLELEEVYHVGSRFYVGFYFTTNQKHDEKKYRVKRYNYFYRIRNL